MPAAVPPDQRLSPAPITHRSIVAGRGSTVAPPAARRSPQRPRPACRHKRHAGPSLRARRRPRPLRSRHRARLRITRRLRGGLEQPRRRARRVADRGLRLRPGHPLLGAPEARDDRAREVARPQRRGALLGHLPLREVGQALGLAARRGPRRGLGARRRRPRPAQGGREADRALPRPGPARPAAGARPPHGRRGDHLGLRLLGRGHGPVPAVLAVSVQARQAAPQGRQDDRAPRPPAHRPDQGGRGQEDLLPGPRPYGPRGAAASIERWPGLVLEGESQRDLPRMARADEAALVREHDGLDAAGDAELGHQPGDVRLDRRLASSPISRASAAFECPRASRRTTSRSRSVSTSKRGEQRRARVSPRWMSTRRLAIGGASSVSPVATARTASHQPVRRRRP